MTYENNHFLRQKRKVVIATIALGSQLRQRLARVRAKMEAWESHFMPPGV
jgi:hypothetical protein